VVSIQTTMARRSWSRVCQRRRLRTFFCSRAKKDVVGAGTDPAHRPRGVRRRAGLGHRRGTGYYTSEQFRAHLAAHGLSPSIGRTGVCWDNAMAESFHGALKNELVHRTAYPTRRHARADIVDYIEVFYNRQRLHSALGYRTR
jgi:putative transposase